MTKQILAIALCRVSSTEQLENNSLNRQRDAVLKAASLLGVSIPDAYWWSGSVSSKRGTNIGRKDLQEAIDLCKKDKRVKYVIVDEPDRFMRSINEAAYFEVTFEMLGVKVWYASDPELNKGDLASKLLKFTKYLSAEGSNEERQTKSIAGQTKALQEGRYPFSPKPGYKRGYERGVQEIYPIAGPALKEVLIKVASHRLTPSQGLIALNKSKFSKNHTQYKMDKFRKILTDPFYAGIVEINKQVKFRNENGLHEPLISKEQHYELLRIMNNKKKNQSGPPKNGNPKYPMSNQVICDICKDQQYGRLVGLDLNNGKKNAKIYEKYRCRSCGRYQKREDLHKLIERQFKPIPQDGLKDLLEALELVWKEQEGQASQEVIRTQHKISVIEDAIIRQIEAVTDPANDSIKDEILQAIKTKKVEKEELEENIYRLSNTAEYDKKEFLKFAFDFVDNIGHNFLDSILVTSEERIRCKEIIFPAGFHIDVNNNVYTPEISELYGLVIKKKDTGVSEKSLLVRVQGL
jgi:DNA invertase Pin-like site-specific DNA recombinase